MFLDLIVFLFHNKKVVLMKTGGNVGVIMLISSWSKNLFPVNNRIGDAQRCSFRTGSLINYYI